MTSAPTQACEGRDIIETDAIQLSSSLQANQTITNRFSLSYTIESPTPITRVSITINDSVIGNYNYTTTSVQDTKSVRLSNVEAGKHTLQIIAIDTEGKGRRLQIPINLVLNDTDKPYLDTSTITITPLETG